MSRRAPEHVAPDPPLGVYRIGHSVRTRSTYRHCASGFSLAFLRPGRSATCRLKQIEASLDVSIEPESDGPMLYVRLLGGTTGFGFDGSNQGAIKAADELAEHLEYNAEGDRWIGGDGWRSRVRSRRRDTGCRDEGTPVRLRHTARIGTPSFRSWCPQGRGSSSLPARTTVVGPLEVKRTVRVPKSGASFSNRPASTGPARSCNSSPRG